MLASEQRTYRQLVGKLIWMGSADLRCAMEECLITPWTHVRVACTSKRDLRGNPGIMTVQPTTLNLEAVKRAPEGVELRHGCKANLVGTRSPRWARSSRRPHSAMVKLSWLLHSLDLVKAWAHGNSGTGY